MVNNKGMTLVELIVTFSLLLIIIIGMFNIIMEIKSQLDEKQIAKDFTEYSATMNNKIHYDLLKNSSNSGTSKFNTFAVKQHSDDNWTVKGVGNSAANLFKDNLNITENMLSDWCKNVFPCVIFGNYEDISSKKILAIQAPNGDDKEYGIYYDGVFEPVPNQDYIAESADEDENKVKPSINITENKTCLVASKTSCTSDGIDKVSVTVEVDFPLYIKGNTNNYGFKIFSQDFGYKSLK